MQLLNFTIIKLTISLVTGILIGYFFNINSTVILIVSGILIFLLGVLFYLNKSAFKKSALFGLVTIIAFISIGVLTITFHNQTNQKNHYTNYFSDGYQTPASIKFKVRTVLKPGNYYSKYIIDFIEINNQKVKGKSLLNVEKDSINKLLKVDDVIVTNTVIKDLISPLNPNQFDYKKYLKKQHIYHQLFIDNNTILRLSGNRNTILGYAAELRETINLKLIENNFKADELAIINALLLGQRQDISDEIYNNYTQAGAIHILAVSGLHVGIILLILNLVFKPVEQVKYGKTIKTIIILLLLWSFAIIAGLSASVTRAVTMFSIVAIGMNLKRPTNIYNTLAISMFVLLLIKPTFIFDVGFQLSYLAVFSIVWIQPLMYKLWNPKNKIVDKFWQIFTVTVAAQFGIIPVSLYYFHQFPSLFFVSNLVIIPVLGIILGLGILVIILALLNLLPPLLAEFYSGIISLLNTFIAFISNQEAFLFKHISFGLATLVTSYVLIIALVKLYQRKTFKRLIYGLIAIGLFIGTLIFNNYNYSGNEFIIFHKSRYSLIGNNQNRKLLVQHNLDSITEVNDKVIINYKVGNSIKTTHYDSLKDIYKIDNKLILVIDSLGVYKTSFKPDYVLLRNSPKINLDRLIKYLQPTLIIADGSNYKSYQERWKSTCKKQKLPFHQTSKKGAFVIKY